VFGYAINNVHNGIIAMELWQFNYEVNTDHVPWFRQCL
jgi:hypothetical protein